MSASPDARMRADAAVDPATPAVPVTRFTGSIATGEFAAARARLDAFAIGDPRRPLPLAFRSESRARPAGTDVAIDGAVTDTGPIGRALDDLGAGRTSCAALVDAALDAVERRDRDLHAVVALLADDAAEQARALDAELAAGEPLRPLHGVPITVKDVIDVAGVATRCGSEAYHDVPAIDASGVARLRAAGAVVLAKVSTHEFALGVTSPQSRNPHDPTRIPGGSSGGSAIAVSTGMGLGSLGTDTRASIRVPAALSGVVGFKPTLGRVPTTGVVSLSWTMDHVAPMATTVGDAARLLAVLLDDRSVLPTGGDAAADVRARFPDALTIGLPTASLAGAEPDVEAAVRSTLDGLAAHGHRVAPLSTPSRADLDDANALGLLISRTEAATFHRSLGTDLDRCWVEIADQLRAAADIPAVDYLDAQRARAVLAERFLALFADHHVLAMPTSPVTAPTLDSFADYLMVLSRNAIPWSLVGFPAVSIPCGRSAEGLPIGIQLVAPPGGEATLVSVGRLVEAVVAGA